MSRKKLDSKTFAQQKRTRRQWLTFIRMCRYGINNFTRNAWLTIAATAVMTITLLIVFMTLAARSVLVETVATVRDKVDVSIYVKYDINDQDVQTIQHDLEAMPSVKRVTYISPEQGRTEFAQANKDNTDILDALNEATGKLPGTFRINPVDINNTDDLRAYTETNETLKANLDPNREPSFAGDRRAAIENIGRWISFADKAGIIASVLFIAISSLIVFNTIRMAIFNRKDEIQMMKLIGADRNFIRGPFVVEAVVYGFIAAVIATAIGLGLLYAAKDKLLSYGVGVEGTIDAATIYIGLIVLGMIGLGALIGIISSLLATRKYLRI